MTSWVFATEAFAGLDLTDRHAMTDWLARASTGNIDTVADFSPRPWHVTGLDVVIGVFEKGQSAASWLLVRYQSRWVVATIRNDTISDVCDSLSHALDLISRESI